MFKSNKRTIDQLRNILPGVAVQVELNDQQAGACKRSRGEDQEQQQFGAQPRFNHVQWEKGCAVSFDLRDEFVARSVNRFKMARVQRVELELLTQLHDVIVYSARRWITVVPPHLVQQLVP